MRLCCLAVVLIASACAGSSSSRAKDPLPKAGATVSAASPTVAIIDGTALTQTELDGVMSTRKLDRDAALTALIDTTLVRQRAKREGIVVDDKADDAARAAFELALARKMGLTLPPGTTTLAVNHAWVKDAASAKERAANRKVLEKLRAAAMAGTPIPAAWKQLGVPGTLWHIGDHEEYPYEVLPPEARDTPAGKVSVIAAGDGGLHLFEVHARKEVPPAADAVHPILVASLREGAKIELR